jgi:hypothetical protein
MKLARNIDVESPHIEELNFIFLANFIENLIS